MVTDPLLGLGHQGGSHGIKVLAGKYLLFDPVEGSNLQRCVEIQTQKEFVCKVRKIILKVLFVYSSVRGKLVHQILQLFNNLDFISSFAAEQLVNKIEMYWTKFIEFFNFFQAFLETND